MAMLIGLLAAAPLGGQIAPELEWAWSILGEDIGALGLEIGDLDSDGLLDVVGTSPAPGYLFGRGDYWWQLRYDGQFTQVWTSLPFESRIRKLRLAETEGSTLVVVAGSSGYQVVDGLTKSILATISNVAQDLRDFAVGNLLGDDSPEIALCEPSRLTILDLVSGAPIASAPELGCTSLAAGQLDSDVQLELALLGNSAGAVVIDSQSMGIDWSRNEGFGSFVQLMDVVGDTRAEIVCGVPSERGITVIDAASNSILWENSLVEVDELALVDIPDTPTRELLIGDSGGQALVALDASTGAQLWSRPVYSRVFHGLTTGDLDGDNVLEAFWGTDEELSDGNILVAFDLSLRAAEGMTIDLETWLVGLSVGDFDADGAPEILTASRDSASLDGGRQLQVDVTARRLEYLGAPRQIYSDTGRITATIAAQLDSDPQSEVCIAMGRYLYCEDGLTHQLMWLVELPYGHSITVLAVANTGHEVPAPMLLAGTEQSLVYAFDANLGWLEWRSPSVASYGQFRTMTVADADSAPDREVVATSGTYDGDRVVAFAVTDGSLRLGPHSGLSVSSLDLAQLDEDQALEAVVGTHIGDVRTLDLETGTLGPPTTTGEVQVFGLRLLDLDGDGEEDLVFLIDGRIQVRRRSTSQLLWESPFIGLSSQLVVANVDSDMELEIVASSLAGLAIFEVPFFGMFADGFESEDTSAWSSTLP